MALERKTGLKPISDDRLAEFGGRTPFSSLERPGGTRTALASRPSAIGPTPDEADAVVDREQHSCVVCGRGLDPDGRGSSWSIHHRRRVRTDNRLSNLVAVCGGADVPGCHQKIHAEVATAQRAGWLIKRSEIPARKKMAHSQFGWVELHDDGGWTRVDAEFIPREIGDQS